ncbi:MAG TPA: PHP domain-containing protein [Candidatus Lokiarchaeia archaeon]|nr:PHP domain-containing protein [Candidatus Lokiarchaeia archaeon]
MLKFDSHVHTRYSDGTIFYNGLSDLKRLVKRDKITAFTITDHNTTGGIRYARKACDLLGIPFIPGVEISAKEGHVVAYGIEDWQHGAYQLSLAEVLDTCNDRNAVLVVAHPLDRRMGIKQLMFSPDVIKRVHGYEILNGASPRPNLNLLRSDRAPLKDLCMYAGSDCHSLVLFCKFHVLLDCDSTRVDDILEAMRNKRKVHPAGPVLDLPHWIADFPPAFTHRRGIKHLEKRAKESNQ